MSQNKLNSFQQLTSDIHMITECRYMYKRLGTGQEC